MSDRFTPILPDSTLMDIFAEIRRLSERDKIAKNTFDDYGLGPHWYHLSIPHILPTSAIGVLEPGGHINGIWHTTFVKLRPEVADAIKSKGRIFWPPVGLEIIHRVDDRHWLYATGAHHIGGCVVCYLV